MYRVGIVGERLCDVEDDDAHTITDGIFITLSFTKGGETERDIVSMGVNYADGTIHLWDLFDKPTYDMHLAFMLRLAELGDYHHQLVNGLHMFHKEPVPSPKI